MKKVFAVLSFVIITIAVFAYAAGEVKTELRPSQKAMQARAGWMKAISENLAAKKYDAVASNAEALSSQTRKAAEIQPTPLGKDLTLAISSLAGKIPAAAALKDDNAVKTKLEEIKGKCSECHVKIRDRK